MFGQFRNLIKITLILVIIVIGVAQTSAQDDPVVYGVLFYSPTCPHCHTVINEYVPQWESAFGDSFVLLYVNVAEEGGATLFRAVCETLEVDDCGGVPMMVIGEEVMIGSADIPARTPGLISNGLSDGGIGLPPVPLLQAAYAGPEAPDPEATSEAIPVDNNSEGSIFQDTASTEPQSLADKLSNDPQGNSIAMATLVALVGSLIAGLWLGPKGVLSAGAPLVHTAVEVALAGAVLVALSLAFESSSDTLAAIMAWGTVALLIFCVAALIMSRTSPWTVPIVALAGMLVAIYLAQVEMSDSEAVCGMVGDCNAVQQSSYAELFGVLPIGVLGVVGYIAILLAWAVDYFGDETAMLSKYARAGLLGMTVFGILFSTYLTFLEPFVIGATCAWCITSALTMLLLFWLVAPKGWIAYREIVGSGDLAIEAK